MTAGDRRPAGAVEYREHPRSYREVAAIVAVLVIGFLIDLTFDVGGAVAHLPGWIVAVVLVGGLDAVFVAAARSTRAMIVTSDEVWVGDEMIERRDVVGVVPPDTRDLPVLGWPNGKPGRTRGVALRLGDGREVLVPSRRPQRLAAVLGATAAPGREPAAVRAATDADLGLLAEIDERAEIVFRLSGVDLPAIEWTMPDDAVATFVADDPVAGVVGFAVLTAVDGDAHLAEIAVLPSAMRGGLGSRLLEHAVQWAAAARYPAVTLTTFADVPWNAPWYSRRGFVETSDCGSELAQVRVKENEQGLDAAGRRVTMRRAL